MTTKERPRYCQKVHWTKRSKMDINFGRNDLIPNRSLALGVLSHHLKGKMKNPYLVDF